MTVALTFLIIGVLDLAIGILFWYLFKRARKILDAWPDPGPWGEDKAYWNELHSTSENMRVIRVVCINTGGSFLCTGLFLLLGAPI